MFYEISKELKQNGAGKTMGLLTKIKGKNDIMEIPAPNKYNLHIPNAVTNIIMYQSKRSELYNVLNEKFPSPEKYDVKPGMVPKPVSFTNAVRDFGEPDENPGVGSYDVKSPLNTSLGLMGIKLKKAIEMVTPSAFNYNPNEGVIRQTPQRSIDMRSKRIDFSKSITGPEIGPGLYQI